MATKVSRRALVELMETRQLLSAAVAEVAAVDAVLPVVSVKATDAMAHERNGTTTGGRAVYTFTRTGDLATELTVPFTMSGTATEADDYAIGGEVIIPAGKKSATVTLNPNEDARKEGTETAILTITPDAAYTVSARRASATVRIADWYVGQDSLVNTFVSATGATDGNVRIVLGDEGQPYFTIQKNSVFGGSTYAYSKEASNRATLTLDGGSEDGTITVQMEYRSNTTGKYTVSMSNSGHSDSGSFRISRIPGAYAPNSVAGSTVNVRVKSNSDRMGIGQATQIVFGEDTAEINGNPGVPYTYMRLGGGDGSTGSSIGMLNMDGSLTLVQFGARSKISYYSFDMDGEYWETGSGTVA